MSHKLKAVLIGYGYWGRILEKYLNKSEYIDLCYINDPILYQGISIETILTDSKIDAAFVCTPIDTHYEIVKDLLMCGKHVFCEKPLTRSLKMAQELARLAVEHNVCLYTDYIYTLSKSINYLKKRINSIGKILSIEGEITQFGNFYKNDSVEEVLGVHLISAVLYILDETENIIVENMQPLRYDSNNMLEGQFILRSSKAPSISLKCSLVSESKSRKLWIKGEHGNLVFDMLGTYTAKQFLIKRQETGYCIISDEEVRFDETNNLVSVIDKFYHEVTTNSNGNLKLALAVTDIIERLKATYK